MLHAFLADNASEITARTRTRLLARTSHTPTEEELKNGVPLFVAQIIERLSLATSDNGAIVTSAASHGGELLLAGFTVGQVVQGYGDVCQVVTELADEKDAPIAASEFHIFNRCLDDAIAQSVTEYERRRDLVIAGEGMERLASLAHELRNRLNSAMLAFTILQDGTVGIGGSTGAVLGRNLRGLRDLINRSLADVRLDAGLRRRDRISVAELIGEAEIEAGMEAKAGGFCLGVSNVAQGIDVEGDPQILAAALGNLLQNAFKFSHAHGHVALRASVTLDRVLIEVEDECGGLPAARAEDLFHPFEQQGENRSGLGLGLTISRKGVEAMGGVLGVRDLPGVGCVFFIDMPAMAAA